MSGEEVVPELDPDEKLMLEAFDEIGMLKAYIGGIRGWLRIRKDLPPQHIESRKNTIKDYERTIDLITRLVERLGEKRDETEVKED